MIPTATDFEFLELDGIETRDVFKDAREYEEFVQEFYDAVRPQLIANAEARRQSEEEATRRWIR